MTTKIPNLTTKKPKPIGCPPKFKDPKEMTAKGELFFKNCDEKKIPYTITGLCIALGFTSRQALINYEGKASFVDAIKKMKIRVENYAELQAMTSRNPGGPIFILKNHGWVDRQEIDNSGSISISWTSFEPKPVDKKV